MGGVIDVIPGIYATHLCRGFVASAMVTRLVSPGQDLEEFLADRNRL